jgi:rhodanese-related sulfurtransferase
LRRLSSDWFAVKLILQRGDSLGGRLVLFDALALKFRELKLRRNSHCPMCGTHRKIHRLIDYNEFCGIRGEEEPEGGLNVPEITARELKQRLDQGDDLFILDVREPHEYQICNLRGHLIPLGELPRRVHELDSSHEIVAHCRSGKRSAEAVDFLRKAGFRKTYNLRGGILSWSTEVDPSFPRY